MAVLLPPPGILPMLPTLANGPPTGDNWAFEVKWDGVRAIAYTGGSVVRLLSRNGNDISRQYPEVIGDVAASYPVAVFDGEIVAFDEDGRPSFGRLQQRMGIANARVAEAKSATTPVAFLAFDLLWQAGQSQMARPYLERRALLADAVLPNDCWRLSDYHTGDGEAMLAATRQNGLEGLVAKRVDSIYEAGRRSNAWLKIKNKYGQEFVIVGYTPGEGTRGQTIGALLLGYNDRPGGTLQYAGKVGTGFTDKFLRELLPVLAAARVPSPAFSGVGMPRESLYVAPALIGEVEFTEWTSAGMIRHPAFKGLRSDKRVEEIVREVPV